MLPRHVFCRSSCYRRECRAIIIVSSIANRPFLSCPALVFLLPAFSCPDAPFVIHITYNFVSVPLHSFLYCVPVTTGFPRPSLFLLQVIVFDEPVLNLLQPYGYNFCHEILEIYPFLLLASSVLRLAPTIKVCLMASKHLLGVLPRNLSEVT